MKERAKTKREDMCHCLKTMQVSSICVFLCVCADGGLAQWLYGGDEVTLKLVRTIACASNRSDPCPYRRVRRGRDP